METKLCELCGKAPQNDMRFGVCLCDACVADFSKAAGGDVQQLERLSDPRNFPHITHNAYDNIILNMARRAKNLEAAQQARQTQTQARQTQPAAPTIAQKQQRMREEGYAAVAEEGLYANIGGKIKSWAKWIFVVESITAIISAFGMMAMAEDGWMIFLAFLVLLVGPIVAFVSSWILYAYGEMVEKTVKNEENTRKILEILREKR